MTAPEEPDRPPRRDPELHRLLIEATRGYARAARLAEELEHAVDDLRCYLGETVRRDRP